MDGRRDGTGPGSRRRPPWGLLGMIGLVAAIEWSVAAHDIDFTTPMHWDWRQIGRAATRPDRVAGKDVLFFGDSLVKFSLMPKLIKQRSGKVAYNFALHTGQTSTSYFMLRRALRAGARPSSIVLDLTPHMLAHAPVVNQGLWPELLSPAECLDLAWSMRDPEFLASILAAEVLPSFKERHEIRAEVKAWVRGQTASRRDQIPVFRRNWKVNDGAVLFGECPPPSINIEEWNRSLYPIWWPNPVNLAYLDRFLGLARSSRIPVYWLLPPILPELQAKTEATGYDLDYTNFVRRIHARFPEVRVVDARHSGFTPEDFMDGAHVNRRGAFKLSAGIADLLRGPAPDGTPPRWVALDLGRVGPVALPMEDVSQSGAALHAARAKTLR